MGNIILDSGTQIITKDSTGSKGVPLDARGMVNYYEDIKDLPMPYIPMKVIVNNDSLNGEHQKGEYVVTKLTDLGDVDETAIIPIKDYIPETDPTVPVHVKAITQQNITDWNGKQDAITPTNTLSPNSIKDIDMSGKIAAYNNSGVLGSSEIDTTNIAVKSEMSIADGTGADAGTATIQLKNGTNKKVLTQHQSLDGKVDKVTGKGLSTNDYDNTEKGKVANAIQTPGATENDKIPVMRNGNIEWESKPSDGLSAFQLAQQEGFEGDIDAWLASLKANIGAFKFVDTDLTALSSFSSIGDSYNDTIDGVTASADTKTTILLMNDANPATKTMMITTEDDGNDGYQFVYAGDLNSAIPSNVLTETRVDNTALANPASNALAKATDVMPLAAKLEGVTFKETNVTPSLADLDWHPADSTSGYYRLVDGVPTWATSTNFCSTRVEIPANTKKIRFDGCNYDFQTYVASYGFQDENGDVIASTFKPYYKSNISTGYDVDLIIDIPENAVYFVCLYKLVYSSTSYITQSKFYIYLQTGENVGDNFAKLYSSYDDSIVSETDYASDIVESQYRVILDVDDNSIKCVKRPSSGNSRISWITSEHFEEIRTNGYRKLHIVGHSSRAGRIMFTKKAITSLPSGTNYYFDYLYNNGYLCEGTTANTLYTVIYASSSGTTDVTIPDDCNYIYIQYSRPIENTSANCAPSSIIPFSKFIKGDIEKIVDKKIENFTPIIVEDNLNSLSANNALSANQGRLIGELIVREHNIIFLDIRTYAVTSSGTWGTSTDYAHAIVSVKRGEKYRIENYDNSSDNIRYAFLTSDACTAGGNMPLLSGTTVKTVNHNTSDIVTIPDGCKFLTFMKDKPGVSDSYKVRLYKYIYINDKEFFDDYSIFDDSLPQNASAYHEGWNDLVNAGLVERSSPYYMEWDTNEDYPIYTYRIQRELEYMVGYNPYHIRKGEAPNYYRRKIMITCGIHGSERLTPNSFLKWVKEHINDDIFAACNFVIIPLCNPWGYSHTLLDGSNNQNYSNMGSSSTPSGFSIVENSDSYYYGIRKTRNVSSENSWTDINRDFDDSDGFTSEEAKYIRDVYIEEKPDMVIDFHQDLNSKPSIDTSPTSSNAKCGFINFGPSNVQEIRDKLIECRRKAFTQINKANYATDCYVNKYFANKTGQFSYTWGGIYPDSQSEWSTTHEHNWHNYASGGSGNSLHQDCAVRYSFTAETDVFCKMIGGSGRPNNAISNAYGYIYMTNFLSRIFDVFDMGDLDRPVISNEQTE